MYHSLTARSAVVILLILLPVPASAPALIMPSTRLVQLWHTDVPLPHGGYEHAMTMRDILVLTSGGVLALGADDGRERWRHQLTTSSTTSWDITAATVMVDYRRPLTRASDRHRLIAMDSGTGQRLWLRQGWSLPPGWKRSTALRKHSAVFLIWQAESSTLAGIDHRTGEDMWSFPVPAGCTISGSAARAADMVILLSCGRSFRVLRLNAATGRTLKAFTLPGGSDPALQTADDVIALSEGNNLTLYDDLGRAVLRYRSCWPQCAMARDGDRLLTAYHSGEDDILAATSWPDGAPLWQVRPAPSYVRLIAGGVAARATGQSGLPVIDTIDISTGATTSYSLPAPAEVLGAVGQRIYTGTVMRGRGQTPSVRVSGLRRVPWGRGAPLLGGVDPRRWPNACDLRPDESFTPAQRQSALSGHTMPSPVSCTYSRQDGTSLRVRVLWVADDPYEAADLLATLRDVYAYRPVIGVGDAALADTSPPSIIVFRVGTVVATVTSGHFSLRHRLPALAASVAVLLRTPRIAARTRSMLPAAPPRLKLVHLPGTRMTLAESAAVTSPITGYLVDDHTYVLTKNRITRFDLRTEALSPNGTRGATTSDDYPSSGRDMVTILDTGTGSVRQIPTVKAPMGVARPVWSPDGQQLLLTASKGGTITGFVIIDMSTMNSEFIRIRHGDRFSGAFRWGGDLRTVAVQSGSPDDDDEDHLDITFFDLRGGVKVRYKNVGRLLDEQGWMPPSGRLFATRCPRPTDRICAWRAADGALAAQTYFNPAAFASWYGEDHLLGWRSITAEEQNLVAIDLLGNQAGIIARTPGHDGLKLVVDQRAG